MKLALVALLSIVSSLAIAENQKDRVPAVESISDLSFTFGSSRSYYHCDFVEAETESMLKKLGAQNINVTCSGGLPDFAPNFVDVQFKNLKETTAEKSTRLATLVPVEFKFNDSCDLRVKILSFILPEFTIYDLEANDSCWDSRGRINYSMKVLN